MNRLTIKIKDSTDIAAMEVDGMSISQWIDMTGDYEFKVEYKSDFLSDPKTYLFKLKKESDSKGQYELAVLDGPMWYPVRMLLELGEIKIRRLFYKRCIDLINELEESKTNN